MAVHAAIDIGTNTLRLLVADAVGPDDFTTLHEEQEITRLGEGLMPTRLLQDAPRRRSLTVLRRFADLARSFKAVEVAAVCTSAVREARNGEEFVAEVGREVGLALRVIDGGEEARLTLLGIRHGLRLGLRRVLAIDIGGGSTEFILAKGDVIEAVVSTGLGVVKLTERYLVNDPPTVDEQRQLEEVVGARIDRLRGELPGLEEAQLVGTAGTVTTLAAIDLALVTYDRQKVQGHCLRLARVREFLDRLAALPLRERRGVPGLESGRADIILAGAAVLAVSMERHGYNELRVSDDGLREGILLDLLRKQGRRA
ncbi:MAG: Ppx/GppA family phosphatase [Candidatus Methylomirabilis oxyfera]|nr:Ppx/GppA family phosphatase [Candidatus Methylomirabilis oxyfera]